MSKKILIIDDDPDFVEAVSTLLEAKGYQVESSPDSEQGVKKARLLLPDLIILDVMMTKKTEGFDAARAIKQDEKTKKIPVVMITGIRREMNLPFGLEPDEDWLPVRAFLEKPVKPEILLKTVEEHLK